MARSRQWLRGSARKPAVTASTLKVTATGPNNQLGFARNGRVFARPAKGGWHNACELHSWSERCGLPRRSLDSRYW